MAGITSLGIGSGLDLEGLIGQLVVAEGSSTSLRLDRKESSFQAQLSAFGTFRSALDTLRTAAAALKDLEPFDSRLATSSNEELFGVAVTSQAEPGIYSIEVAQLATPHKLASQAFADISETAIGTGTLTITVNGESVDLEFAGDDPENPDNTLAAIRDAINEATYVTLETPEGGGADLEVTRALPVAATIVTDGDGPHLVLSSENTGVENEITVTASGGDGGLDALIYDPLGGTTNLTELSAALDADVRIDGFTVTSASNTVAGAIEGITLDLIAAEPGTVEVLTVERDVEGAKLAIAEFADAYNGVLETIDQLSAYDAETQAAGALQGDSLLARVATRLRRELTSAADAIGGPFSGLRDIGFSGPGQLTNTLPGQPKALGVTAPDGSTKIDEELLEFVLAEEFDAVGQLFAHEEHGFAVRFDTILDEYLKADGLLDNRKEGIESSIEDIGEARERLEERLQRFEARMRDRFIALDLLVANLTSTSNFLTAQLSQLPAPDTILRGDS